jgi:hypothetical protein
MSNAATAQIQPGPCTACHGARTTVGHHPGPFGREYSATCERCAGTGAEPTCEHCGADLTDEEIDFGARECFACEAADICDRCLGHEVVGLIADEALCARCLDDARRVA